MCADPITIALGGAQIAQTVAGHNNQVSQIDAQNRNILSGYNQRKSAYEKSNLDRVGMYAAKLIDVEIGQDEAALAARKAESQVDLEEDAALRAILAKDEELQLKQMQSSNFANEGGRARSFRVNEARLAGRQRGKLVAAADELTVQSYINKREARLKGDKTRKDLYRTVNLGAGTAGPAPEMPEYLDYPSEGAAWLGVAMGAATIAAGAGAFKNIGGGSPPPGGAGAGASTKLTDPTAYLNNNPSQFTGGTPFNYTPAPTYPNVNDAGILT